MASDSELRLQGMVEEEAGASRKRGVAWSTVLQKRRSYDGVAPSSCWEEGRILQLMMGPLDSPSAGGAPLLLQDLAERSGLQTLKAPGSSPFANDARRCTSSSRNPALELDSHSSEPLPSGWEKCLDLQTGNIYYLNRNTGVSTSCDPRTSKPLSSSAPPPAAAPHQHLNPWLASPTSPSSSSDLTFEGVPPAGSGSTQTSYLPPAPASPAAPQEVGSSLFPPRSELDLDLSLRLRPCTSQKRPSPAPRSSLKHSLIKTPLSCVHSPSLNHIYVQASTDKASTDRKYSRGGLSFLQQQQQQQQGQLSSESPSPGCANCNGLMAMMLPAQYKYSANHHHPKCPRSCGASIDINTSSCGTDLYSHQSPQPPPSKKAKPGTGTGGVSLSLSLSSLYPFEDSSRYK